MNNNHIQIDRYLQNEMSADERNAFEAKLTVDKELQQELQAQQQIINATTTAGLKMEFAKAIRKKIIVRQLLRWGLIAAIGAAVIVFFVLKNNHSSTEKNTSQNNVAEKFAINVSTDTIIETKDGIVFAIPAHAFNTNTNTVEVEIKTVLNAYDIIKNGLSTMSNDALLQTAGMFYINGFADGKAVPLTKAINVSVPAASINANMQLFDGVEDGKGNINWVNPKPVDKSLRTYDITTLDFYPPKYLPTVKALGKDYLNKIYTDSLYYSFSGYGNTAPMPGTAKADEQNRSENYPSADTTKKIAGDSINQTKTTVDFRDDNAAYQLDPARVRAIWDKKFNNTILATKEFEERLHYLHTLCTAEFLKIYVDNLDKPLFIADELCAKLCGHTEDFYNLKNKFLEFAARKDDGVSLPNGMQHKLSIYFQQKYKAYKDAAAKTWAKYQSTLDSLNKIADAKRLEQSLIDFTRDNKNFNEEFCANLTSAYHQIGKEHDCNENILPPSTKYYNVTISTTGWKNLDVYVFDATVNRKSMSYTDPASGKTATLTYNPLTIKIDSIERFDRVLVYLIPDSLSSFQRVEKEGDSFKEQLNTLFKYDAVVLAYQGTQAYFFKQENAAPKEYLLHLLPVTKDVLQKTLSTYSLNKTAALKTDFDYQFFEQQETMRRVQLQKDQQFRETIAQSIFNCLESADAIAPMPQLEMQFKK